MMLYQLLAIVGGVLSVSAIETYSNWAVLIAGSNGYYNYRHQADISHAYHILTDMGGYPPERVIVMMYDDIAYNAQNPFPGQIFNEPNGVNYYEKIKIDYNGSDVNAETFLNVLQGKPTSSGGPVLKSTKNDNVFIYYSDHGATGLVAMPSGPPLYADDLIKALEYMDDNDMYEKLVFYLEACESGSMFDKILPSNISVYATTAANPYESSFAFYYNATLATYMADEYSIRWMQDTEANWNADETLLKQYDDVKQAVKQSHPQMYGDYSFDNDTIEDFEGYDKWSPDAAYDGRSESYVLDFNNLFKMGFDYSSLVGSDDHLAIAEHIASTRNYDLYADSRNVKLITLYKQLANASSIAEEARLIEEINAEIESRVRADLFRKLVSHVIASDETESVEKMISSYTTPTDYPCLKAAYALYDDLCEAFNDYSLKYVRAIVNLCEHYDNGLILDSMAELCYDY